MPRLRFSALIALLVVLLPAGCSNPYENETFVRSDKTRDGVYIYSLPLEDSLSTYDFWFYSRTRNKDIYNLELKVLWLDPSGDSLSETVYMEHVGPDGVRELYRSGMVPARPGQWQLSVKAPGAGDELLGLGLIYKRNDGTR